MDRLSRGDGDWLVEHSGRTEAFERVVVASGRFQSPYVPIIPGLETFSGSAGAMATYHYREPGQYLGKRVLVAGGAISALEIASELAQLGVPVEVAQRRQRYVLPKFAAGVPSDSRIFTRYGTLANETLPPAEVDRQLKEIVVEAGGSPEQYGAPAPDPSLFAAGVTLAQQYLPLVAEGRITVRPWLTSVDGQRVTFADGTSDEFDGILFGTGFEIDLPFLSDEIGRSSTSTPSISTPTAIPSTPTSRSGFRRDVGPVRRTLRATGTSGPVDRLRVGRGRRRAERRRNFGRRSRAYRARRGMPQKTRMNLAALTFARAAGVEPNVDDWPHLRRALLFGPLVPSSFRLQGPDALPDAASRFARDAAAFGAITTNEMTEREQRYLALVEDALVRR